MANFIFFIFFLVNIILTCFQSSFLSNIVLSLTSLFLLIFKKLLKNLVRKRRRAAVITWAGVVLAEVWESRYADLLERADLLTCWCVTVCRQRVTARRARKPNTSFPAKCTAFFFVCRLPNANIFSHLLVISCIYYLLFCIVHFKGGKWSGYLSFNGDNVVMVDYIKCVYVM